MSRTDWHIVSEYEELSQRNGSAILTVAKNLQLAANQLGHQAWIIGSHNENNNLDDTLELLYPKAPLLDGKIARAIDKGAKYTLGKSTTTPDIRDTGVTPSHIYCHNQPWILDKLRKKYPYAKIYLYAHNKLMQGARASTIRESINKYDEVICVSDFIRQELGARAKMTQQNVRQKMTVHLNGVDSLPYTKPTFRSPPEYDVVFVGRMVPEKGVHVLAEALANIAKSRDVSVLIVGGHKFLPGTESDYIKNIKQKLKHNGIRSTFTGPVPPVVIPSLINSARIHVVPSIWDEPCALVLLEGLASRACAISTLVGGLPEVAEATTLQLVPPEDVSALEEVITNCLDNPERTENDAASQREWATTQSWLSVYKRIVASDER